MIKDHRVPLNKLVEASEEPTELETISLQLDQVLDELKRIRKLNTISKSEKRPGNIDKVDTDSDSKD